MQLHKGSSYQWFGSGDLAGFTGGDSGGLVFTLNGTVNNLTNVTNYKNHGAYVSSTVNKNDAAHSCIGMPVNSNGFGFAMVNTGHATCHRRG